MDNAASDLIVRRIDRNVRAFASLLAARARVGFGAIEVLGALPIALGEEVGLPAHEVNVAR